VSLRSRGGGGCVASGRELGKDGEGGEGSGAHEGAKWETLIPLLQADHVPCTLKANGKRCASGAECCSGRCVKKRGTTKRFCRKAPGQATCTVVENICETQSLACNSPGTPQCVCYVAKDGFSFCGRNPEQTPERCFICDSDADCETRDGGQAGDRCVYCSGTCTNNPIGNADGTACISRCPNPA
jgi:hypothetical protein